MDDYKSGTPDDALKQAASLYSNLALLVKALRFDEQRALDEVNGDYATTTELADTLQREADIPFRAGPERRIGLRRIGGTGLLRGDSQDCIPHQRAPMLAATRESAINRLRFMARHSSFTPTYMPQGHRSK